LLTARLGVLGNVIAPAEPAENTIRSTFETFVKERALLGAEEIVNVSTPAPPSMVVPAIFAAVEVITSSKAVVALVLEEVLMLEFGALTTTVALPTVPRAPSNKSPRAMLVTPLSVITVSVAVFRPPVVDDWTYSVFSDVTKYARLPRASAFAAA